MNNGNNLENVKIFGMFFIIILGLVFHELYKSTDIFVLGVISPVNESKWEHWKMVFWPMIIVSIFEYYFIKDEAANYIFSLAIGIIVFELTTFGLIELYDSFIGQSHLFVHVTTFLMGGFAGQTIRYIIMTRTEESRTLMFFGVFILSVQFAFFTLFTFHPPMTDYFRDSIKGTYGIFNTK